MSVSAIKHLASIVAAQNSNVVLAPIEDRCVLRRGGMEIEGLNPNLLKRLALVAERELLLPVRAGIQAKDLQAALTQSCTMCGSKMLCDRGESVPERYSRRCCS